MEGVSVPIVISCSACNTRLTLGDDRAGDRLECPQCDAMLKVPGPSQPPARTPAAAAAPPAPQTKPSRAARRADPDPDDEPEKTGPDLRVMGGIVAGVVGLFFVVVAVGLFAFRKPAETAKAEPEPAVTAPATSSSARVTSSEGGPPEPLAATRKPTELRPNEPTPVPPPTLPQFSANFLGSQGQGRRFCIIADNSGSMNGAKLADLKTQLVKTLSDLDRESEYSVFFFNSIVEPMPVPGWVKAGAPESEKVRTWVRSINARGGTQPTPAFEAAFRLNPPPDVIFFMTDGLIPVNVPDRVVALNGTPPKTVVNTIMFAPRVGKGPIVPPKGLDRAELLLKQISDRAGGTFTRYVP
jgi:hypothetical protein